VPLAVVENDAFVPWHTVWSAGSVVEVFALTVSVALCEALPQVPVTVTATVWLPTVSDPVGTLMLDVLPPNAEPSRVQA
jgi:hypothetical protein